MKPGHLIHRYRKSVFMQKLGDSFAGIALDRLFAALLPLVAVKIYGATVYGEFTYYFSMAMMASVFAQMGLPNGLIFFMPRNGNRYVSGSFLLSGGLSLLIGLGLWISKPEILPYIPLLILISVNHLFFSLHRYRQDIRSYYVMDVFLRQGLIGLLLFALSGLPLDDKILISYFWGYLAASLAMAWVNRKHFSGVAVDRELISYSIPLMFTAFMNSMISHIDAVMIGDMIGKEAVGVYAIAASLATVPSYLLRILNTVYVPQLSRYFSENRLEEFKRSYILSSRILGACALVIVGVLVLADRWILGFFGPEFLAAENVILYRGLGQVVNSGVGSAWFVISMSGKPRYNMYGMGLAALLNAVMNWMLIPVMGIDGAALASMAAVIFTNLLAYIIVKRMYHVKVYGIF